MRFVDFIHRSSKPTNPKPGCFYWIENGSDPQLWFAPDEDPRNLLLLNNEIEKSKFDELVSLVSNHTGDIIEIQNRLSRIEEILDNIHIDLTDSDYDKIADKVSEKLLTWKVI